MSTIFEDLTKFETRLGLPSKFYERLLREDDWSFVIKLNALFEGACTHVLSARLHAPELTEAFAHLELANSRVGKVELLRKLSAVTAEQSAVLRALAELRNKLVHDIANIRFSFSDHVAGLDKNQLKALVTTFGHGLNDTIKIGDTSIPKEQFVRENPKLCLWLTAAEVLGCLYLEFAVADLRFRQLALAEFEALRTDASRGAHET